MDKAFLDVFEKHKQKDICFGGNCNLALQRNLRPYINYDNKAEVSAFKHLLPQFLFFTTHVCYCKKEIEKGISKRELRARGYTSEEISSAMKIVNVYGSDFEDIIYMYIATAKIGYVARTIKRITMGEQIPKGTPKDIIDSANRRIKYATSHDEELRKEIMIHETEG